METNRDWSKQYYSDAVQEKIAERQKKWTPELQAQVNQQWNRTISRCRSSVQSRIPPARRHRKLWPSRWRTLVAGFTGGDPEITQGLGKLYQDRANWSVAAKDRMAAYSNPKVWEYIRKAFAAGMG